MQIKQNNATPKNLIKSLLLLLLCFGLFSNAGNAIAGNVVKIWVFNATSYTLDNAQDANINITIGEAEGTHLDEFTLAPNTGTYIYADIGSNDYSAIERISVTGFAYYNWMYYSGFTTDTVIASSMPQMSEAVTVTIYEP